MDYLGDYSCWICKQPIPSGQVKVDAFGFAVHEACYAQKFPKGEEPNHSVLE
jgi:hypothetical protein